MTANQFFISSQDFPHPVKGKAFRKFNLSFWADDSLEVTLYEGDYGFLLFGFIFDPLFPSRSNSEILQKFAAKHPYSTEFYDELNRMAGRFVLIIHAKGETRILNDAAAQRQLYYHFDHEDFRATSSPKLFYELTDFQFEISPEKQKILDSKRFSLLEQWFPGNEYIDNYLNRLLPNCVINPEKKQIERIPYTVQKMNLSELKENIRSAVYGAMEACVFKFSKTFLGMTAGADSRLIVSCTPRDESIEYFIFTRESENDTDLEIAKKLSEKRKLNLSVVKPNPLTESFKHSFQNQFLKPRNLSKLRNIEWLYESYRNSQTVVVVGYAGELLRASTNSINPYHQKFETAQDFVDYLHFPPNYYLDDYMKKWVKEAEVYAENCDHLTLLDLFHWEQHMAPYCAQYAYEQDFAEVELFCPLANRQMILNLIHNTTSEERREPVGIIYQIIDNAAPHWDGIPYNPKSILKQLKDRIFKKLPLIWVNRFINR